MRLAQSREGVCAFRRTVGLRQHRWCGQREAYAIFAVGECLELATYDVEPPAAHLPPQVEGLVRDEPEQSRAASRRRRRRSTASARDKQLPTRARPVFKGGGRGRLRRQGAGSGVAGVAAPRAYLVDPPRRRRRPPSCGRRRRGCQEHGRGSTTLCIRGWAWDHGGRRAAAHLRDSARFRRLSALRPSAIREHVLLVRRSWVAPQSWSHPLECRERN
jgi:hypothetical protein